MTSKPAGAYVMIGGGIALAVGSFLPWIKVTAPFVGTLTKAGTDGGGDGWVTLVLGLVAVVVGIKTMHGPTWLSRAGIALGFIAVAVIGVEFTDVHDRLSEIKSEADGLVLADVAFGLYLCAAGAVAVVIGSMLAANRADEVRDEKELATYFP